MFTNNEPKVTEDLFLIQKMDEKKLKHAQMLFSKVFVSVTTVLPQMKKSAEESLKARQEGNALYKNKNKNFLKILSFYGKSLAFAPWGSEEQALALSNRSQLCLDLKEYHISISEIEKALKITKSPILKAKLLCRKAKCLILLGDEKAKAVIREANAVLKEIDSKDSKENKLLKDLLEIMKLQKDKSAVRGKVLELPKFTPSKKIPCASDAVILQFNEEYGRHVVANKDIKVGEILAIEEPYVTFPHRSSKYMVCSHCLVFTLSAFPCEYCAYTMYCSDVCKCEAWDQYHDLECEIIASFDLMNFGGEYHSLSSSLGITVRLAVKAIKEGGISNIIKVLGDVSGQEYNTSDNFDNKKFASVCNLKKYEERMEMLSMSIPSYSSLIVKILRQQTQLLNFSEENFNLEDFVEKFLLIMSYIEKTNAFGITFGSCSCSSSKGLGEVKCVHQPDCMSDIGSVLALFSSMFNHSCIPNVTRAFAKGKIIFIAAKSIKKNEQCFITYGPTFLESNKKSRQEFLTKSFYFICNCIACKKNWGLLWSGSKFENLAVKATKNDRISFLFGRHQLLTESKMSCYNEELYEIVKELIYLFYNDLSILEAENASYAYKSHLEKLFQKLFSEHYDAMLDN